MDCTVRHGMGICCLWADVMIDVIGFDIETASLDKDHPEYALQPWRLKEGRARITLSCAWYKGKKKIVTEHHDRLIDDLKIIGRPVVCHNSIFDIAWLQAADYNIQGISWGDSMLATKFLDNSQTGLMSFSLKSCTKKYLKDWEHLEEFQEMKSIGDDIIPGEDPEYWAHRVTLDSQACCLLFQTVYEKLTPQQRNLLQIQAVSLPMFAHSWVNGIRIDLDAVKKARPEIIQKMILQEEKLNLLEPGSCEENYIPSKVLRSSTKLRKLLYEDYKLECTRFTAKGAKSTDKSALHYLADRDMRVIEILKWREMNTILSKFINTPIEACKYLGSTVTHASPRIFATYTGRCSYSSKSLKAPVGMAIHQISRDKSIRKFILARSNEMIVELDAKSQEGRLMAIMSDDAQMKKLFRAKPPLDDAHSYMTSRITGETFEEFLQRKAAKDPQAVTDRNTGKFVGLAYNYRSSPATARRIANVQYGIDATIEDTTRWKTVFMEAYPGIPKYWKSAPKLARARGYAETIAGARYAITQWNQKDRRWGCDSSAINYPVQGSGADMKYLAAAVLCTEMPDLENRLLMDLHDGLYFSIPEGYSVKFLQKMLYTLDKIDYKTYWNVNIDIPLTWECSVGYNMGNKIGVDYSTEDHLTIKEFFRCNK